MSRPWKGPDSEDTVAAMEVAEWDWVGVYGGSVIHHVREYAEDPAGFWVAGAVRATTSCGRALSVGIPNVFERMGAMRCSQCCQALGIPLGMASPKNAGPELRTWVESRIAAYSATPHNRCTTPEKHPESITSDREGET